MSRLQIVWARSHDWFVSSSNGSVTVQEILPNGDIEQTTFTNFDALYIWAGY